MTDALAHDPVSPMTPPWTGVSLVDLFSSACQMTPHALAFGEAPFSTVAPARRLTYQQADEAVDRLAIALGGLSLPPAAVVAVCLSGTIEAPLTVLAVLRAGFVPCLLPVTMGRGEAAAILAGVKAEAFVAASAVGTLRPADVLRSASVESGPRYMLGFGARLPAGLVPLDDALADAPETRVLRRDPAKGGPPLGVITVERRPGGAAAYRHDQEALVAAALAFVLRARMGSAEQIVQTIAPMSHAGLVTGLVPSLLTGGALHGQSLFESAAFLRLLAECPKPHVVIPSALEAAAVETGILGGEAVSSTTLLRRPPVRIESGPGGTPFRSPVLDLLALGERACLVARRTPDGRPALSLGETRVPDDEGHLVVAARASAQGLLSVSGPGVALGLAEAFPDRETDWTACGIEVITEPDGQIVLATPATGRDASGAP